METIDWCCHIHRTLLDGIGYDTWVARGHVDSSQSSFVEHSLVSSSFLIMLSHHFFLGFYQTLSPLSLHLSKPFSCFQRTWSFFNVFRIEVFPFHTNSFSKVTVIRVESL